MLSHVSLVRSTENPLSSAPISTSCGPDDLSTGRLARRNIMNQRRREAGLWISVAAIIGRCSPAFRYGSLLSTPNISLLIPMDLVGYLH